jgi:hypothetical protein
LPHATCPNGPDFGRLSNLASYYHDLYLVQIERSPSPALGSATPDVEHCEAGEAEEQVGNMFVLRTGAAYRDLSPDVQEDLKKWRPAMEKVADLLLRTSTVQSEIAATVHFAAGDLKELKAATPTEREVLDAVMKWKQRRKPPLNELDAAIAIRNLAALGWIDVLPSCDLPLQSDPVYEAMICE